MRWTWIVLVVLFAGCKSGPACVVQIYAEKEWDHDTRTRAQITVSPGECYAVPPGRGL